MDKQGLEQLVRQAAQRHGLDEAILCGQVERESTWNPYVVRYEPAFRERYLVKLNLEHTEEIARSMSYGLLQVMGEVAREFEYRGELAALCDPALGIEWGARVMAHKLAVHQGNIQDALQSYNGGANPAYGKDVLALAEKYKTP